MTADPYRDFFVDPTLTRQIRSGELPGLSVRAPATPKTPPVADVRTLELRPPCSLYGRVAGVFLFVPFLVKMQLETLALEARMAGGSHRAFASGLPRNG